MHGVFVNPKFEHFSSDLWLDIFAKIYVSVLMIRKLTKKPGSIELILTSFTSNISHISA